jgi:hypothetical protein
MASKILVNPTEDKENILPNQAKRSRQKKVAMNLGFLRRGKWKVK